MKTQPQYKTFDELLDEVIVDFHTFNLEGMIDPQQLIKVALRVNYELGLKINQTKDAILDIEYGKAKLPPNFYVLNYANIASKYTVQDPIISGTHIEEKPLNVQYTNDKPCVKPCVSACGNYVQLVQTLKSEVRTYEEFHPLEMASSKIVSMDCPNLRVQSKNKAELRDGFIFTSFDTGKVHINYQSTLEDEDGNLLVLDHPLVNEFYEYALKQRILENLYINGEDVSQRIQIIEQRFRAARNNALSFINTPDFADFKAVWEMNRKAMYGKYYNMFKR